MNIKITFKSIVLLILCMGAAFSAEAQSNTGFVQGKVLRKGAAMNGIKVYLLSDMGDTLLVNKTSINGEYYFGNLAPGPYRLLVLESKTPMRNFQTLEEAIDVTTEGVFLDLAVSPDVNVIGGVKVSTTKNVLTSTTATTKKADETNKMGLRNITTASSYSSGVTSTSNGVSGRASRVEATAYYVDGVRVNSTALTQSMGGQVDILQAGIPAQYGDFTGVGISVTTKGGTISNRKGGSVEMRSTSLFNPYHHNLFEASYSTPILKKINPTWKKTGKGEKYIPTAAMFVAANFNYQREPQPSYIGYTVIKDDALAKIEDKPLLINQDGGFVHAANYLNENDYQNVKVRPNTYAFSSNANLKLDFKTGKNSSLTMFGNFNYSQGVSGGNNIMAYKGNPLSTSTYTLGYIKYTQTFKNPEDSIKAKRTTLNNTTLTLRVDYQSTWGRTMDNDHRDRIFDYGYIGSFTHYPTEFYSYYGNLNNPNGTSRKFVDQNGDTVYLRNFWEQTGFRDTAIVFKQADINTVRGNYTKTLYDTYNSFGATVTSDQQILQGLGLLNGYNPINIYSLWNTPGTPLAGYSKSQSERYTMFAMLNSELKGPISSASKQSSGHKLQFGIQYEQSVARGYGLGATNLWRLMYQYANSHISELDKSNPILSYDANGVFQDTIRYNRLVNTAKQSHFDKAFRDKLIASGATDVYGKKVSDQTFIDINSYKPSDFTLDMFSADELLNNGSSIVSYYGYDHLGNKMRGRPGLNDFLQDPSKRAIGAFMPIYTAAWFEDNFNFKDLQFRLGLRVERYDANQYVLKDPYSLYPIKQAGEVKEIDGNEIKHPSNIGSDYAVYVDDVKNPRKILGYRKDNTWYDENGNQLSTPELIANRTSNGKIAPYLVDPNNQNLTTESFSDYKPKVNILPRVFFKFPLNKTSLFYASYDVLAQRPNGNFITIDDYYYMTQKASDIISNPALTSRLTTDYQIGFKKSLAERTQLNFISYYRETKNDISAFQFNNAYPITYISYNNLDFSTAKGMIVEFEQKSKDEGLSVTANYTLQFADGTGSNINSQRALIASNQPNLRSLFPLGDLDIRHQMKAIFNWEFFDDVKRGKIQRKYNGPRLGKKDVKILKNTNFNLAFIATSGLPYTATSQPVQLGSVDRAPIKGSPFGSRLPWQVTTNLNIQKDIPLKSQSKNGMDREYFLQMYLYVTNLFNTQNVYSVYPYTGSVKDDGFLNSPKGQQALQNQLNAQAYSFYYNTAVNSPFNYQTPRMIYLGAKFYFQ